MTDGGGKQLSIELIHSDCLEAMARIPGASVDFILTDPPYFRVKSESWDRQWDTKDGFLSWLGDVLREFRRVLKPNGSLYLFASPQMAARVEVKTGEFFNVLNRIRWNKEAGWHNKAEKEALRSYLSPWEEIIFAEQFGADSMALGESGYAAQCEKLHGFVFEPLRAYLDGERRRAGIHKDDCNAACGFARSGGMASRKYFSPSQWQLPTPEHYAALRRLFNAGGGQYLRRDYEDLRREYEDLRREYEDLRRPFSVSADVPYTDVWDFPTVKSYPGKHPCEKPQSLLRHAIVTSSRPGAVVLDAFAGTASTGLACLQTGRNFIGIEKSPEYYEIASRRIADAQAQLTLTDLTLAGTNSETLEVSESV